jgi:predicted transcriptional regulator
VLNHILCFQIAKKKEIFRQQIKEFLDKEKEFKETKKHEEEIEEKLTKIYGRSKQKIENMQKEKEHEVSNYTFLCSFLMLCCITLRMEGRPVICTIKNYRFC